jgi:hypothetical protein
MAADGTLARVGSRALELGLGVAALGLGAAALLRAVGSSEPLAAWASGLGAVPVGAPAGIAVGVALLVAAGLLAASRLVPLAGGIVALLALASLVHGGLDGLAATLDVALLTGALGLIRLPRESVARLPRPLAVLVDPDRPGARPVVLRLGLALTLLLASWELLTHPARYLDLLAATGGLGGWPLGGGRPLSPLLWLGTVQLLLGALLIYGPPVRLASLITALLVAFEVLLLHTPSVLAAKGLGIVGAALASYCWASGVRQVPDTTIGWLRAGKPRDRT